VARINGRLFESEQADLSALNTEIHGWASKMTAFMARRAKSQLEYNDAAHRLVIPSDSGSFSGPP
jgi:hypothetical protein